MNKLTPGYIALKTVEIFERTDSGKSWKKNPVKVYRWIIDHNTYNDMVNDAVRYKYRIGRSYTYAGYVPTTITTVESNTKVLDSFVILYKPYLFETAGYREKDIVERAVIFEHDVKNDTYTFYTSADDSGHRDGCEYSFKLNRWIG